MYIFHDVYIISQSNRKLFLDKRNSVGVRKVIILKEKDVPIYKRRITTHIYTYVRTERRKLYFLLKNFTRTGRT